MSEGNVEPSDDRPRNDRGQYIETVTQARVLDVLDRVEGPTITSTDVADALGCSMEAARRKLTALADRGVLNKRTVGRTTVWWQATPSKRTRPDPDRDQDYLKSFGKYAETNIGDSVAAVSDRLDRDLRERQGQRQRGE